MPPFDGLIKDGYLWGRGALDMKGMGVLELMTVLTLKRRGVRLRRPVRFLAVADEEAGSDYGAEWLDREHPDLIDGAFVINEGGYGSTSFMGVERPAFGISMAEKSPLWLTLRAKGRPGHGSAPHDDNVLDRMVRAMTAVQRWNRPYMMTPPMADAMRAAYEEGYIDINPDKVSAATAGGPASHGTQPAEQHDQRHRSAHRHQTQRHPRNRQRHARLPPRAGLQARELHRRVARRDQ